MNKTKDTPIVNPAADDDIATDEVVEIGEQAIAKYADGLETTDEAIAALDATDRQLQKQGKHKKATPPRTTRNVRPAQRAAKRTLNARKPKATARATTKRVNARAKGR